MTQVLENVVWKKNNVDVSTLTDYSTNYVNNDGSVVGNSQTATLQINDVGSASDDYQCVVDSAENSRTAYETTVKLGVFSKFTKLHKLSYEHSVQIINSACILLIDQLLSIVNKTISMKLCITISYNVNKMLKLKNIPCTSYD